MSRLGIVEIAQPGCFDWLALDVMCSGENSVYAQVPLTFVTRAMLHGGVVCRRLADGAMDKVDPIPSLRKQFEPFF